MEDRTIPHRELRNNSSAVLEEVRAGATLRITNHGEVVAVLVPPGSSRPGLRIKAARIRGGFSSLRAAQQNELTTKAILDELRDER